MIRGTDSGKGNAAMGIFLLVGIVVVIAAFIIGIGFSTGRFRLERVTDKEDPSASTAPSLPRQENASSSGDTSADGAESDELADYDFFMEEAPAEEPAPPPDEREHYEYDRLCNLKIGRGYMSDCQKILNTAAEEKRVYAVLYMDFDRFRIINALKGLSLGDYSISRIAQEASVIFPEGSRITRVSADHFAVLFQLLDESMLADYANQLKRASDRIRDDVGGKSGLRVSMGVAATASEQDYNIMLLMQKACLAHHCVKASKEQIYMIYNDSMTETLLYGEQAMESYDDNQYDEEYSLFFYPLYDIRKGRIVGCETLARWNCELSNNWNVPLSSENGRLATHNAKILYQTTRLMSRLRKSGKELLMCCVTLHAVEFFKGDIDAYIARCLSEAQVDPAFLVVELDINVIRVNFSVADSQIAKLREIGVRVCIFNIDRGYRSLDALQGLTVDYIKLQAGFAHNIGKDDDTMKAAKNMIAAANDRNILTIFEGVNHTSQMNALKQLGAHFSQGDVSGRPDEPDEMAKHLLESIVSDPGNVTSILSDDALSRGEYRIT